MKAKTSIKHQHYRSTLGGTVGVFGYCNYGDDEKDD